jgi:hypothetical protein
MRYSQHQYVRRVNELERESRATPFLSRAAPSLSLSTASRPGTGAVGHQATPNGVEMVCVRSFHDLSGIILVMSFCWNFLLCVAPGQS